MGKLPAIQFYPGDWRKDSGIQSLNYHEKGVWMEILFFMHESEQRGKLLLNGKPVPEDRLSRMLHLDKQETNTLINTFLSLGVADLCPDTGALMNRRMVRDEKIREQKSEAGRAGGGNPNFTKGQQNPYIEKDKQNDKQGDKHKDKQNGGSSVSSSVSVSSSNNKPNILSEKEKEWKTSKQESFEKRWLGYPGKKDGKKASNGHWNASIKKPEDIISYDLALGNYKNTVWCDRNNGFKDLQWKNGSTWFNNWQDYIPAEQAPEEPTQPPEPQKPRVPGDPKLEKLWTDCLGMVKSQVSAETYLSFESAFPRSLESGILIIAVPNQVTRKMMIENYREMIELFLKEIAGKQLLVDFCIDRN